MRRQILLVTGGWSVTLAVSLMVSAGIGTGCSGSKSTLSGDVTPSPESEEMFGAYGKIADDESFKQSYLAALNSEIESSSEPIAVKVQGVVINDLSSLLRDQLKIGLSQTKIRELPKNASRKKLIQFVEHSPLNAVDFEKYRAFMSAKLLAGKNAKALSDLYENVSLADQVKSIKVGTVLAAMGTWVSKQNDQEQKLSLLLGGEVAGAAVSGITDIIKTAMNNYSPVSLSEANLNNAQADESRAKAMQMITDSGLEGTLNTQVLQCQASKYNRPYEKWKGCTEQGALMGKTQGKGTVAEVGSYFPKDTCTNGVARDLRHQGDEARAEGGPAKSSDYGRFYPGNPEQGCQEVRWDCVCEAGYRVNKTTRIVPTWVHDNSSSFGCAWHLADSQPKEVKKPDADKGFDCDTGIIDYIAKALKLRGKL
ncbi:MAG: hypothetical protein FJ146_01390 [Deltaproteobacteria bacterium]|nr:hypothetical protein [Deltaproteobacteria bacterium]